MTKQKRKTDQSQSPIIRWLNAYSQWLKNDFRTYRPIYFLPLSLLIVVPVLYLLSGDIPEQYMRSDHILFPILELLAGSSGLEIYIGIALTGFIMMLFKMRGLLSLIILTIPLWGFMGTIGAFIIGHSHYIIPRDSIVIDNYMYRLVSDGKSWNSFTTDYIVYECDSVGIQCDLITEATLCQSYGRLELKLDNRQLQVHHVTHTEPSLHMEIDLDSKKISGEVDCPLPQF